MTGYALAPRSHPGSPVFHMVSSAFLLGLVCTAIVSPANLWQQPPARPLPACSKEVPHLGELDHISTSLAELLLVPAGFSFPQLIVTLLHVLQTAP